jgi:tRNA(adenine34) deaminase
VLHAVLLEQTLPQWNHSLEVICTVPADTPGAAAWTPPPPPGKSQAMSPPPLSPMQIALEEARAAAARGEVPVGAVITDAAGQVLARAGNRVEECRDPAAHAEMLVLRQAAAARRTKYLVDCVLTATLEPCPMCAAAASLYRIRRLAFGAYDPKGGGVEHGARVFSAASCHHVPESVGGVREAECAALLRAFFAARR